MMRQTPQIGKFKKLLRKLRPLVEHSCIDPETIVVGILEKLWHATAAQTPCGDIGRIEDELICETVGWRGDPEVLMSALVDCRWLDKHPEHRLIVHDWPDHCPNSVKQNLRRWGKDFICPSSRLDDPEETPMDDPKETPKDLTPNRTEPNRTKPNQTSGRLTSDEGDQIEISIEEEVRDAANKIASVLGPAQNINDRSIVLKVAWLSVNRFGESWLINGTEAVRNAKKKIANKYAYFTKVLDESCDKLKPPRNFKRELALLTIPDEALSMPPPRRDERLCAASSPED